MGPEITSILLILSICIFSVLIRFILFISFYKKKNKIKKFAILVILEVKISSKIHSPFFHLTHCLFFTLLSIKPPCIQSKRWINLLYSTCTWFKHLMPGLKIKWEANLHLKPEDLENGNLIQKRWYHFKIVLNTNVMWASVWVNRKGLEKKKKKGNLLQIAFGNDQ